MNDTSPDAARKYRELLLRRSGEDRLRMGCSMHATARALVVAGVIAQDPAASAAKVRREIFTRFYADDFDAATREHICGALGIAAKMSAPSRKGDR